MPTTITRRRDVLAVLGWGASAATIAHFAGLRIVGSSSAQAAGPPYDVLERIPASLHDAIRGGAITRDLESYFDAAAGYAIANVRPLYVPAGTFTMHTWHPPANLTVLTAGRSTIFKQLPTRGTPQRFIRVLGDGVNLWPGGAATIAGNIAANATSFNSGVQVYADNGATIRTFTCGDIYGENLGGDVLETGSHPSGRLGRCEIGTIYGANVYRNIVSITAGATGHIAGVIQTGGVGFVGLDFEPDAGSGSPIENWTFRTARCHRVNFSGDAGVPIGEISGDLLDLSYTRFGPSQPAFNYAGVSARTTPTGFQRGVQFRNCRSVHIREARIAGFPQGAIVDIGETPRDHTTSVFRIDRLELSGNGAASGYEIVQQKTAMLSIGDLRSSDKVSPSVATLIGGTASGSVAEIETGRIDGRVIGQHTGNVRLGPVVVAGRGESIIRYVEGAISLDRTRVTGANILFDNCTEAPVVRDATLAATTVLNATRNARFLRSTVNNVFHPDSWAR